MRVYHDVPTCIPSLHDGECVDDVESVSGVAEVVSQVLSVCAVRAHGQEISSVATIWYVCYCMHVGVFPTDLFGFCCTSLLSVCRVCRLCSLLLCLELQLEVVIIHCLKTWQK